MKKSATSRRFRSAGFGYAAVTALAMVVTVSGAAAAQQPDNSKVNARDRQKPAVTADQQSNKTADVDITKRIRQALVADKSLSTYAHNVKVITSNGKVTLKGPVRSAEEKKTVVAKAAEVAGADNVIDQISVAANTAKKKVRNGR